MEFLWEHADSEMTGRAVADAIPENAYTTVATVLDRLVNKGLVQRSMDGRPIRYVAMGSQGAHTAALMRAALTAGGDARTTLPLFTELLSREELAILRHSLARAGTALGA